MKLRGCGTALVTPFRSDGSVDEAALRSLVAWQVAAAFCAIVAISALAARFARQAPYLLVGWLWYLGTLVPVLGLVSVGVQARADRYTYVPLVGIFVMAAFALQAATASRRRAAAPSP